MSMRDYSLEWRLEWTGIQTGMKIWTGLGMQKVMGTRLEHLWVQGETEA